LISILAELFEKNSMIHCLFSRFSFPEMPFFVNGVSITDLSAFVEWLAIHSKYKAAFWEILHPYGCVSKAGVVRKCIYFFLHRTMFSHIRKASARVFH